MEFFDTIVTEQAKKNVMEVLNSGHLSEGEWVRRFEQELENQFGYRNGVTVNSGTSALHLALILAGAGQGDEVILPAQTFVATGMAVLYCGAMPVFADIGLDGNLSVDTVLSKVTEKTRAIIAVAWGGLSPDLNRLSKLCQEHGIYLITDNAHALGSEVKYENYSCFSFQAIKQLTTGDGGLLVCRDPSDSHEARKSRWFGIDRELDVPDETGERFYNIDERLGYKYHMNNIAAAVGLGNLENFQARQTIRQVISARYDIEIPEDCLTQVGHTSTYWLYDLLVDGRSDFIRMMKSKDIPVSVVHVGIDRNEIFGGKVMENENQRYWDEHHVCIPCHSSLTDEDVQQVIDAIKDGWG